MNQDLLSSLEKEAEKLVLEIPAALDSNEFTSLFNEKLVELVIRECRDAVLSVPTYYKDYRSQIEEAVIHDCAGAVLSHFGIE